MFAARGGCLVRDFQPKELAETAIQEVEAAQSNLHTESFRSGIPASEILCQPGLYSPGRGKSPQL